MEVEYYEEFEDLTRIGLRHGRTRFGVVHTRKGEPIRLTVRSQAGDDCCDRVEASLEVCFSCEEWARLLCELQRIHCGGRPCSWIDECCDERGRFDAAVSAELFDQDDEDECEPERREQTVFVSVGELRAAIKGRDADDIIEISEG